MRRELALTLLLLTLAILPWNAGDDRTRTARVRLAVAIACNVLLVLLVVVPWQRIHGHLHWDRVWWLPFPSAPYTLRDLRDVVGNVFIYIPLGYGLARLIGAPRGRWLAVLGAAALSLATEGSQLLSAGRYPSVADLTYNVLGAWLGAIWSRPTLRKPHERLAPRSSTAE